MACLKPPPLRLSAEADYQLAVTERPALWRCPLIRKSDNVTLLREFLLDEAPGSLIDGLRARGLAEEVSLDWLYQDDDYGWLALTLDGERPEAIDAQITRWLRALQQTTQEQQRHYYRLAQQRFSALSPLTSFASGRLVLRPARRRLIFPPSVPTYWRRPPRIWPAKKWKPLKLSPARDLPCRLATGVASRLRMRAPSRFPSTRRLPNILPQP